MDGSYSYLCGPEKQIQTWATIGPHIKYHKMAMFFIGIMMIKSRFPVCQPPRFHINMVACSMFILTHPTHPTTITRHQKLVGANTLDPQSSSIWDGLYKPCLVKLVVDDWFITFLWDAQQPSPEPVVAAAGTVTGSRVLRRQDRLSNSLGLKQHTQNQSHDSGQILIIHLKCRAILG